MFEGPRTLSYAVRTKVILKYLGQLTLMLAALTLVPLSVSVYFGDYSISYRYLTVIGLLVAYGWFTAGLEVPGNLQTNEALTIIALIFLIAPLLMAIPVMGSGLGFADALFETISAITTTGLTTVSDVEIKPKTFLFARAWMQWYGGLGIVILSVALFMRLSIAARRLTEPLNTETFVSSSRTYARHMLAVYVVLTVVAILIVWLVTGNLFVSLTHVLAGISTGGFSTFNNSLAGVASIPGQTAIVVITIFGALPLPLFYLLWKGGKGGGQQFFSDIEFKGLMGLIAVVCGLLSVLMYNHFSGDWRHAVFHGLLLGISAQTTTGFATLNIEEISSTAKLVLIISMIIGGGTASSAGGIKILRFLILLRLVQLMVQRTTMPSHALTTQKLGDKSLESDEMQRVLLLIVLFILVIIISWLIFLVYGYDPINSLFEVVSAIATVGLSTGLTHSNLPVMLKSVLAIDMLLGRLEIVAFLVLLYPRNWFGLRAGKV